MVNISICDDDPGSSQQIKEILENYSKRKQIIFNITIFNHWEDFKGKLGLFDICFIEMDLEEITGMQLTKLIKINNPYIELVLMNEDDFYQSFSYSIGAAGYLIKPIFCAKVFTIMHGIMQRIQSKFCIVNTKEGKMKLPLNELLYIDVEGRYTCFRLKEEDILGLAIRGSFIDANRYLLNKPELLFIKPTLILNIDNIKSISRESLKFSNDKILYLPRKAYDQIYPVWSYYLGEQLEEIF